MKVNQLVWMLLLMTSTARLPGQVITTQPTNQIAVIGSNATFSVVVSGNGPFTYQWQFDCTNLPKNVISTVAGNGIQGFTLDYGVAATNVSLNTPYAVALDTYGNIFIADTGNNIIRKVDTNGIITNIAGDKTAGYSGDNVLANYSSLNSPEGLAVDALNANGNLYIADVLNNRIRHVAAELSQSYISTVAGDGTNGYYGDGGAATSAELFWPDGVAVDTSGNLFIADYGNCRIRKVDTNGIIATIAGNGIRADTGDGGMATNASLDFPTSITLDGLGNLFFSTQHNIIRKVNVYGIITTVAGNGTNGFSGDDGIATNACLSYPNGLAVDALGNLFIADFGNERIREVNTDGIITTVVGNGTYGYFGDGGPATNASLANPEGVAVDSFGGLFIADTGNNVIRKVVAFASLPNLLLNDVTTNNAGSYRVIITGSQGSVTSSVVTLVATMLPVITSQPLPLTLTNGNPASFAVAADGWPTLAYQWYFNGMNVPNATNSLLAIPNCFPANAGTYSVVAANSYGSVTSNPALLAVLPLGITAPTLLTSGQFEFRFDTATGVNYMVEYSTNLAQWFPLVTVGGVGLPLTVIDPNMMGIQQCFYRIILSPQ
jgi:sugar lactone lactonase YvrE